MAIDKNKYTKEQQEHIMAKARWQAQKAVYLQAFAHLVRTGDKTQHEYIKKMMKAADDAGRDISWDDLYHSNDLKLN